MDSPEERYHQIRYHHLVLVATFDRREARVLLSVVPDPVSRGVSKPHPQNGVKSLHDDGLVDELEPFVGEHEPILVENVRDVDVPDHR